MKYSFIFPGQGSQSIGMGKTFYDEYLYARELFEIASDVLKVDMAKLLFIDNDEIHKTQFTQPAILLVSYIAFSLFSKSRSITPEFLIGHSLGEITANVISGSLSFENAIKLVYTRGQLMQMACDGLNLGMAAVIGLEDNIVEDFCKSKGDVWCANYNGIGQIVLAGNKSSLINYESEIKKLGAKKFVVLPMSVASHCPLLDSICDNFQEVLDSYLLDNFKFSVISNVTTESYSTKDVALQLLTVQLVSPVLYKQSILKHECNVDCFLEFGHGSILKGINKRLTDKPTYCISDSSSLNSIIKQLEELGSE